MGYVERLLAENEEIVFKTRQHWRVLAGSFLANGFLFLVLLGLAVSFQVVPFFVRLQLGLIALVLFVFAIFPVLAFLRDLLEWQNEEYVVTNRRVVQAQGVLSKQVMDSSLDMVNDVVLSQSFLGRVLDYGDIEILTASETGANLFRVIGSPLKFKMAMMNQREARSQRSPAHTLTGDDVAELLKELDTLHQQRVLTDQEYSEKKKQLLGRM